MDLFECGLCAVGIGLTGIHGNGIMPSPEIKNLYYIAHVGNLPSIVERGILSRDIIDAEEVRHDSISNGNIVDKRKEIRTPDQKSLWNYANLYFQPRNPMMYRVSIESGAENLAVVSIDQKILHASGVWIADGNAANAMTQFQTPSDGLKTLARQWKIVQSKWWNDRDGSKRKIMAECLVPNKIAPEHIDTIYVINKTVQAKVANAVGKNLNLVAHPDLFFQPNSRHKVGENISLIDGDMFFSTLQTLTVSVNLQGVMGKGLASRAKYQFPDVYVAYQDACRSRRITATKPYLYKRESSLDTELADFSPDSATPNAVKWFLLFATKRRWQENSRMDDIEGGLDWTRRNFQKQGIQSLAMPALGCGLGGLDWKDVGPVMCRFLHGIGISVAIYLPRERPTPPRYLTEEHLLRG